MAHYWIYPPGVPDEEVKQIIFVCAEQKEVDHAKMRFPHIKEKDMTFYPYHKASCDVSACVVVPDPKTGKSRSKWWGNWDVKDQPIGDYYTKPDGKKEQ